MERLLPSPEMRPSTLGSPENLPLKPQFLRGKQELVQIHQPRKSFHSQAGVSLVESLIGLLLLTIVLVSAAQLFRVQVMHLFLTERARLADTQANALMNSLASYNQSALNDTNAFANKSPGQAINDGDQLSLNTNVCQTAYACDQVARVPQTSGTGADYVVVPWNQTLPTGSTLTYYRAWRVVTIDAAKHLRQITVAIIPADLGKQPGDLIEPLALRQSVAVQRQ
jgi:Tfp pilus assembly protein PilV